MNKDMVNIISNALVTMGYRTSDFETYMKPIGFALLIAKIKLSRESDGIIVEIKLAFNNATTGEITFWDHKDFAWDSTDVNVIKEKENKTEEDIYNDACTEIAYAEAFIGLEHVSIQHKYQTFAFKTSNDIFQFIKI